MKRQEFENPESEEPKPIGSKLEKQRTKKRRHLEEKN
jgi:hypothetical protein